MKREYKQSAIRVKKLQKEMQPLLDKKTVLFIDPTPVMVEKRMMQGVTFFKDSEDPRSMEGCVASRIFYIPVEV